MSYKLAAMTRALTVSLCCALTGCASLFPAAVPETLTEYKPTAELNFYNKSANFDSVRMRAVNANLSKRTDGTWGGIFKEQPIDVNVTADRITGSNIALVREDTADGYIITGQWQGGIVRYEVLADRLLIRTTRQSFTLARTDATSFGPNREFTMTGEASGAQVAWPQIGFALLSMFN